MADWNKYFDGLTTFNKEIELLGTIIDDNVEAVATYQSELVGQLIAIDIILTGTDALNYTLQNSVVYGNIQYRYVVALLDYAFDDDLLAPNHSTQTDTIFAINLQQKKQLLKVVIWHCQPQLRQQGYIFVGWFDEDDNEYTPNTLVNNTNWSEDLTQKTLTAKWSIGSEFNS